MLMPNQGTQLLILLGVSTLTMIGGAIILISNNHQ